MTIGNPCPVYDPREDVVHLMFTRDNQEVFVTRSDTGGRTWETPRNITTEVTGDDWSHYWVGPGHGLYVRQGPQSGRLLFPAYHIEGHGNHKSMRSHMIYSDDHASTWRRGESTQLADGLSGEHTRFVRGWIPEGVQCHGCECMAEQLDDGRLLLIVRNQTAYQGRKGIAYSDDAGESWTPVEFHKDLPGVRCQSSIIRVPAALDSEQASLLFVGVDPPRRDGDGNQRRRLTAYRGDARGERWSPTGVIEAGPSAYSDLCRTADGTILCFYEGMNRVSRGGKTQNVYTIELARIPPQWWQNSK